MNTNANGQEWANLDLSRPSEQDRRILEPYTFATLLLEVSHNIRGEDITPDTIRREFEQRMKERAECAREVFEANTEAIYLQAIAERDMDSDTKDDYNQPYTGQLRRIRFLGGSSAFVGPAGYMVARRLQEETGEEPLPMWSELELYEG
jgi:hypothetical protein